MQNSTLSLVIPHSNKSAAVEAQNEGSFNKWGFHQVLERKYSLLVSKKEKTQLHF